MIEEQGTSTDPSGRPGPRPIAVGALSAPRWIRLVPFLVSSLLYLSVFFAVFAPVPLLLLRYRAGWRWQVSALLTNALIVGLLGGLPSAGLFLATIGTCSAFLPYALERFRGRPDRAIGATVGAMMLAVLAGAGGMWAVSGRHPVRELKTAAQTVVQKLREVSGTPASQWTQTPEELQRELLVELPSGALILSLLLVWANMLVLTRVSPGLGRNVVGAPEGFFKRWRNPDWMVWPTIVAGFSLLSDFGPVSDVGINVFKVLMALYGLQGMAILAWILDVWQVKGLIRTCLFVLIATTGVPLLLAMGFFDLWFDFRAKFRQS
ncbi:MAG TPA: DUF2232 domain-containing protein [Bdellovibrionota bacterium]|nr:DUF2232 domain-containing protein [Bdellovibrionota bacterium]